MKKRPLAALAVVSALVLASYALGFFSHKFELPPYGYDSTVVRWIAKAAAPLMTLGRPEKGKYFRDRRNLDDDLDDEVVQRLAAIGYLGGYEPATDLENVTLWEPELAQEGVNLYSSGHAPEAYLIDMGGKVLHHWRFEFAEAFPEATVAQKGPNSSQWWRHAQLVGDGELLVIYEGLGLIRLDRDSNLLWARAGGFHHEVWLDEDGTIYALTRESRIIPRLHETDPVFEDNIEILDAAGNLRRRISLLKAFEKSHYASLMLGMREHGDIFHTNSMQILNRSGPSESIFSTGRVLVSLRNLHAIAVVDLEMEEVVWALSGMFAYQHDPFLLPNGNIILFDNLGHHSRSKVIEFEPKTQEIVWAYGTGDEKLFSATLGACQRLPNGNTLITESEAGRAFEVTPDNRIVWEFYNPARTTDGEFIATLFEIVRLQADLVDPWIGEASRVVSQAETGRS